MKKVVLQAILILSVFVMAVNAMAEMRDTVAVTLEELNVTAIKHLAVAEDEAQAVTTLKQKELEQLGIVAMRGFSDVVPNFYMPDYGSRITSTIYVRGIGARMDQPSVGLNVDNVPYLNKDAYDFDIADIYRVEMFRGPQSTLYGRNTMAGVINITTLSPLYYQGWRLFGEIGSGGRIKGVVSWYHKLSSKTGLSVSVDYGHLSGFFRNDYNGELTDKENNYNGRLKFVWRPSAKFSLQNTFSTGFLRQGGYPYEYVETGRINYNDTCFYRRFTLTDGLTINYKFKDIKFTSITSVQHIDDNMTLDQDFLPLDYFTLTQKKRETSFTEEIVAKGVVKDYNWLGGLFFFYKHLNMDAPVTFKNIGIRELIEAHRNEVNPLYPIEWDTRQFILNSNFKIPTWGVALYHQSEFNLGNWTFTGALRLDYEKAILDYHSFCDTGYKVMHYTDAGLEPYIDVPIDIDDRGNLKNDYLNLLPEVSVSYELENEKGNLYAKFSKGYKAGGFNTQMFSDVLQQRLMGIMGIGASYDVADIVSYKPEKSWNYEIGSHLNLIRKKLSLELSIFYIDCRDQQLTMFPDGTTTGRIMTNAGKTRSFGGEISLCYKLNERLSLTASYGYTNARFKEFFNGINDYKGKFLPYAPQNTLFLQGLWNVPVKYKDSSLIFDINFRGTGKIYWNEENNLSQNFYGLLGASASWLLRDWEFRVWGRNLTDTRYYTFYFMSMGNEFLQRGRGVEIGLSVRWNFKN